MAQTANMAEMNKMAQSMPKGGATRQVVFLDDAIDWAATTIENADENIGNEFRPFLSGENNTGLACVSDVDPQLLIRVKFNDRVNLTGVVLRKDKKPNDDEVSAPKDLKFFVNQQYDFEDCEIASATQDFNVETESVQVINEHGEEEHHLNIRRNRFQNVNLLTIFIASNECDTEKTFLNLFRFKGYPPTGKPISAWEPCKS